MGPSFAHSETAPGRPTGAQRKGKQRTGTTVTNCKRETHPQVSRALQKALGISYENALKTSLKVGISLCCWEPCSATDMVDEVGKKKC